MAKGISKIQNKSALRNLHDEDINDTLKVFFPANHMNRFLDYKTIISE